MKRSSVRIILAALAATLALVMTPGAAWASAGVLGASSYTSTGASISGWNWVRSPGETATWTFDVAGLTAAQPRSIYLNVNGLVTNGVNGGSGYSARSVKFMVACATGQQQLVVQLINPFKPMDPSNSGGVGYAAYGASSSSVQMDKFVGCPTLTVTAAFPFTSGRHVAFNQQSATLGFKQ